MSFSPELSHYHQSLCWEGREYQDWEFPNTARLCKVLWKILRNVCVFTLFYKSHNAYTEDMDTV